MKRPNPRRTLLRNIVLVLALSICVGLVHIVLEGVVARRLHFLEDMLAAAAAGLIVAAVLQRRFDFDARQREELLDQLSKAQEDLERLAVTDVLTGLLNRRGFEQALVRETARAERTRAPFCIALVDVDDLKVVNDTLGHAEGDKVLQAVGSALAGSVRRTDSAARIGGDEFAAVLTECKPVTMDAFAERLRGRLAELQENTGVPAFSVSVGFASSTDGVTDIVERADRLMFDAKAGGGRRALVRIQQPDPDPASGEQAS